jgi:hypothetical protein
MHGPGHCALDARTNNFKVSSRGEKPYCLAVYGRSRYRAGVVWVKRLNALKKADLD